MAEPRLAAAMLVAALVRRTEAEGGHAMVLARGDATAGALMIQIADRGVPGALIERRLGPDGYRWGETGPADPADRDAWIARRRRDDPDLWVIELDSPEAERIVREVTGG